MEEEEDEIDDEGPEPTESTSSSTSTQTTTTTTTTTTIFDPENVDCVEMQDACTTSCEVANQRNYVVITESSKLGRVCTGATDCMPGEDDCSTTTTTAAAATTTTTIVDLLVKTSSASSANVSDMSVVSLIGLLVGIVILIVVVITCRRSQGDTAPTIVDAESGQAISVRPVPSTYINPVYSSESTDAPIRVASPTVLTVRRPDKEKKKKKSTKTGGDNNHDQEVISGFN
jgi:hypothetical protein